MSFGNERGAVEQCKHGEPIYARCRSCEMDVIDEINNARREGEALGRLVAYQDAYGRSPHMTGKELSDWLKERAEAK